MHAKIIPLRRAHTREHAAVPTEQLVVRARGGDLDAQGELFQRHVQLVHGLVRRLLPEQRDRDDIVQDVFVRALESLHRQRDASAFRAWLRGITVHVVRNRIRRRRLLARLGLIARTPPLADDELEGLVSSSAPPDVLVELRAVYAAVERLETNARMALVLRRVDGLTLPEVAAELGRSLATTKRWIAAGEAQLASELARVGGKI